MIRRLFNNARLVLHSQQKLAEQSQKLELLATKLASLESERGLDAQKIAALEARVAWMDERLLSYYKNRFDVVDKLADYLVGTQIPGDYLEFGVFMGKTFSYAYRIMAPLFPEMRFVALDSFEGLP